MAGEGMEAPILTGKAHLTTLVCLIIRLLPASREAMPSWADRFSNEELWQLTAFVVL